MALSNQAIRSFNLFPRILCKYWFEKSFCIIIFLGKCTKLVQQVSNKLYIDMETTQNQINFLKEIKKGDQGWEYFNQVNIKLAYIASLALLDYIQLQ